MNLLKTITDGVSKNSPMILVSLAAGGVIGTTVMAVKATPKAVQIIDEAKKLADEHSISLAKRDYVKMCWKVYLPTAIMGAATIACMVGSHNIQTRRTAAVATLYSIAEASLDAYQEKVTETLGATKEQKIRDEISQDRLDSDPVHDNQIIITGKGDALCYDSLSGRYFKSDAEKIRQAVNELNRRMMTEMTIELNDLYWAIGLEAVKLGSEVGWNIDDCMIEVEFSSGLTPDKEPCLVVNYPNLPFQMW